MRRFVLLLALVAATPACGRPEAGLQPIYPPATFGFVSRGADFVEVDSLQPTLRWRPVDNAEPGQVTYELRIWSGPGTKVGRLVYARDQVVEAQHTVEEPLEPDSKYLWSVRAHFFVAGRPAVTEWGAIGEVRRDQTTPNLATFRFATPGP